MIKGQTLADAWGFSGIEIGLCTFRRYIRDIERFGDRSVTGAQSWLAYVAPDFSVEGVLDRERIGPGRYSSLGRSVVTLEGASRWRERTGAADISVMGLLQFLSRHEWTALVESGG